MYLSIYIHYDLLNGFPKGLFLMTVASVITDSPGLKKSAQRSGEKLQEGEETVAVGEVDGEEEDGTDDGEDCELIADNALTVS